MIEIRTKKHESYSSHQLLIDGVEVATEHGSVRADSGDLKQSDDLDVAIYPKLAAQAATSHFSDLSRQIRKLLLIFHTQIHEELYLRSVTALRVGAERFDVYLDCTIKPGGWKHAWSFEEYIEEFSKIANENSSTGIQCVEPETQNLYMNDFRVCALSGGDAALSIHAVIKATEGHIKQIHELTETSLTAKLRQGSVVMQFDFPEEVKVPCEQYLLYFAQFLRDLGVLADTALTHEAGQVLFTVTPADKDQALDKIRAALNAYLHLPSNPIRDATDQSIAVQRLEATVLRLRSDLKLAAAELQAKNTTIEAQRLMLDVKSGLLSGEIVVNSMKDVTPKPKDADKEELLGGTVSIIPLKGKGIEINLPELFRRLKRLFQEEE